MLTVLRTLALLLFTAGAALPADQRATIPIDNSPTLGPENAPVTIVEFIDFQ